MGRDLYNNYYATRFPYDARKKIVWHEIVRYLKPWIHGTVVDLGTGHGYFLEGLSSDKDLQSAAIKKIGIDLVKSPYFPKDASFIKGSITDIRRQVKGADVIFASNILEHLDDKELTSLVSSLHSVLRKNGSLIIVQPNFRYSYKKYFDDYTHVKVFTHKSLCDFLEANGFCVVKVMPRFLPFSADSRLPISSLLTRAYLYSPFKPLAGQMLVIAKPREHPKRPA